MADPQDDGLNTQSPEYQLKSLGVYTNLVELKQLLSQLKATFSEDGLYNNKAVFVKLKGYSVPLQLRSEVREIKDVPEDRWESSLFLTDVVSLLTGIAKILNQTGKTDRLTQFKQTTEDDYLLRQWFQEQRSGGLTKESFAALKGFVDTLDLAFEDVLENQPAETVETTAKSNEVATEQTMKKLAGISARVNSGTSSAPSTDTTTSNAPLIDLNDTEVRMHFNTEVNWIYAFARQQLLIKHLEGLGTSFESLPPELQNQFIELSALLRSQIVDLIENLPPEKLAQFLNDVGNLRNRVEIFNLLLQTLLSDPHSQFFTKLNEFYRKYFIHLSRTQPDINIEETIDTFTLLAIRDDTTNEVLQRIAASIQAWKQELIAKFKAEQEQQQQDSEPKEQLPTPQEPSKAAKLPPVSNLVIASEIDRSNFTTTNKEILKSQTPRLLWGTAAELFRDEQGNLGNIDQVLFGQVSAQTLTYILSLESSELELLRTSPSTLIRHIKNLRDRILRDKNFVFAYEKYKANHDVPQISRANRVEKETEWAHSQITFELFASHNITDETTPDENGLQKVFDNLKHYLHEKIFIYFDELPETSLEQLYIKPAQRNITMRQLHTFLNEDLMFVDTLGRFYSNLLAYYGNSHQVGFQQQLQRSLQKTVVTDGVHYRISETTQITSQQLFSESVLTTVNTNNQEVINLMSATAVSATLDSMLLSHGIVETQKLISDINPKLLEMTFGLPQGSLKEGNLDQFRSLLLEFATTRSNQFSALVGAEQARGIFGSLNENLPENYYKNITQANKDVFEKRLSQISTVREVVQNNSGEVVAEAVSKSGTQEKVQVFFKYFQKSWDAIPQEGQIAIYYYYQLDGAEKYWEQFDKKTMSVSGNLPLPIEFIDFEEKNRDGKLLGALITELQHHGAEFNPLLTSDFASDADSVAQHYQRIEQLKSSLTLYYLEGLDEIEQQEIAVAQGFASAQLLMAELQNQAGVMDNIANLERSMALPALTAILSDEDYSIPTAGETKQQSLLNQVLSRQSKNGQDGKNSKANRVVKAFQKAAGKKISKNVTKKVAGALAKKVVGGLVVGATAGVAWVLSNKQLREYAAAGLTWLAAHTLYALSTIGGLALGTLFGALGWVFGGGIPGGLLGTIFGANLGAQIAPWQWGDWLGFTPRQPPGPWFGPSPVDSSTVSMEAARTANATSAATAAQAANTAQAGATSQAAAGTTQAASTATAQAGSLTSGTTTAGVAATITPALQGVWSYLASLSIGVTTPLLALGVVILSTTYVIMIIAGAFIVPVPTRNSDWKGDGTNQPEQESAQFVAISKEADITQIENDTPTDVTYTITITPKGNYSIMITDISDQFGGFGAIPNSAGIVSPLSTGNFPREAFNSPQETSYTVSVGEGTIDSLVTNTLIVSFEVVDINGFVINPNSTYRTSASVRVGDPKEGCWPTSGSIYQLPYDTLLSHANIDAYDIPNDIGTPIYSPFSGRLCRQIDGPLIPSLDRTKFGPEPGRSAYGRWEILYAIIDNVEVQFIFAHLDEAVVEQGECKEVVAQELVGYMGHNGFSEGSHLHYELRAQGSGLRLQDLVPQRPGGGAPQRGDSVNDCH